MPLSPIRRAASRALTVALLAALSLPAAADSTRVQSIANAGSVFGLAADGDSLLVADSGFGILRLVNGAVEEVAPLPGISDVAPVDGATQLALTGGGPGADAAKLWRVERGVPVLMADLGAYEAATNPDGGEINSNPLDLVALPGGGALVADAGANALLLVSRTGVIDWVATLPSLTAATDHVKTLANCPAGPDAICALPDELVAPPMITSVAIGPDGAIYLGELTGFPAPVGASRVWRIEPDARHARCGISLDCSIVADGFTSIVDLAFDGDTLVVTELDEAGWFAVEVTGNPIGGTINACRLSPDTGQYDDCDVLATGIPTPLAVTLDATGRIYHLTDALDPGSAAVAEIDQINK